jgi:dihydrofolate synthase/folylpolyglutamate synthase
MPVDQLEKVAISVFGEDRVIAEPSMPDAIARAVDLVDTDDELGVGYGHGILITGSFVTAGDARILLKETPNKDLLKKKSER